MRHIQNIFGIGLFILVCLCFLSAAQADPAPDAVKECEASPDFKAGDIWSYYRCGAAKSQAGQHEAALQIFDKIIATDPANPNGYYNRGVTLNALNRFSEGLKEVEKAIQLNPKNAYYHQVRGASLVGLSRNEEALKAYEQALALDPQLPEAKKVRDLLSSKMKPAP